MDVFIAVSILVLAAITVCGFYLWLIAIAGTFPVSAPARTEFRNRFAFAIPAHDEESVIGGTIAALKKLSYPSELFEIFVAADFCSDRTAEVARKHGAVCFERNEGERGGKATALRWLFEHIFSNQQDFDAVIVIDADTKIAPGFLSAMNNRLNQGDLVIQGRHIISNPEEGLFPALTWSMMTVDNRFSNQGRNNLGLSAKHMGDSICFRSEVLKRLGWGSGLTEDYEFRLRLLLEDIRIRYEPAAVGYGQAPQTWKEAQAQRLRWAKGMAVSGRRFRKQLLLEGLNQRNWSKIDGFLTTFLPSFSTLALISMVMLLLHLLLPFQIPAGLAYSWAALNILWFIYPIYGLALEKGPWWSYVAIFSGPIFMVWRTWLNIRVRTTPGKVAWIRTPHRS